MPEPAYKRVLLKLSGEALMAPGGQAISPEILGAVADEVVATTKLGCELALVLGGGNIFRGVSTQARGMERSTADYVGMLATVMNAVAMQDALEARGLNTRVQSAINMPQLAEPFIRRRAVRHLEKGRVVIFAAGTGNPYFTTDTAAALRAMEIHADVLLKATSVDGVYDKDPKKHSDAKKYDRVTYMDCLQKNLKVMDMTAFALCRDNKLPMIIFDMMTAGNVQRVVKGEKVGTIVVPEDEKSK